MEDRFKPYAHGKMVMSTMNSPGSSNRIMENSRQNFVDITALIRSVQRMEGNIDCFRRGESDCKQLDCSWRPYCLGGTPLPK